MIISFSAGPTVHGSPDRFRSTCPSASSWPRSISEYFVLEPVGVQRIACNDTSRGQPTIDGFRGPRRSLYKTDSPDRQNKSTERTDTNATERRKDIAVLGVLPPHQISGIRRDPTGVLPSVRGETFFGQCRERRSYPGWFSCVFYSSRTPHVRSAGEARRMAGKRSGPATYEGAGLRAAERSRFSGRKAEGEPVTEALTIAHRVDPRPAGVASRSRQDYANHDELMTLSTCAFQDQPPGRNRTRAKSSVVC